MNVCIHAFMFVCMHVYVCMYVYTWNNSSQKDKWQPLPAASVREYVCE